MTPEYFFNQLQTPSRWTVNGWNHTRNDEDEITVYGKVFDDYDHKKLIRVCFSVLSERCIIVERTRSTNGTGANYKTVCEIQSQELERINDFIFKTYIK